VRLRLALAATLAAVAIVPASALADAVVDNAGDSGGVPAVDCIPGSGNCTLRDAVAIGGSVTFANGITQVTLGSPITVSSTGLTITGPTGGVTVQPAGTFTPLLDFAAGNALVSGVTLTNPGGTAVKVDGGVTGVKVQASPIFNTATPISLGSGSNGGIAAPAGLRVGPRQPDGSLPLTGTVSSGSRVDVYGGDPAGTDATKFLGTATAGGGSFSFPLNPDPAPGTKVSATVTGSGTSEYATAAVPADISSPSISSAYAFSTNEVIVTPSEPLAAGSLNLSDFNLQMAGVPRAITQGGVSPDGGRVYLISNQPWNPGEAGIISLSGPGVLTDAAGNFNQAPAPVFVGAAPGDFQPPLVQNLKITPSRVCLSKSRRCRHPGITISFVTNEVGKAVVVVNRASNRRAGEFVKKVRKPGTVKIKWRGTIHGRPLRAGRYVVEVSMQDNVGNVTDSPPFQAIHILRTR
jgi:hypothetical protein